MDDIIKTVLLAILIPIAGAVGALAVAVLNKFRQKVGLQVDAEQDAKLRAGVQNAILSTEEVFRARIKKGVAPLVATAEAKLAATIGKVLALPGTKTHEEAVTLTNEELPKVRAQLAPSNAAFLVAAGQPAAPSSQVDQPLQPATMPPQ